MSHFLHSSLYHRTFQTIQVKLLVTYEHKSPEIFWSMALGTETLKWNDKADLRHLIHHVLVIPVSSSDVERGFSILQHIKAVRRSSLKPETIDALLRIRVNAKQSLETFNAEKMAQRWIKQVHLQSFSANSMFTVPYASINLILTTIWFLIITAECWQGCSDCAQDRNRKIDKSGGNSSCRPASWNANTGSWLQIKVSTEQFILLITHINAFYCSAIIYCIYHKTLIQIYYMAHIY